MLSPIGAKGPLPDPIKGRVAVVGPCASGKTVLVERLRARGYDARQCAQEHSYVPDMWLKIVNPRVLIYLDVNYETSMHRRPLNLSSKEFDEQVNRLSHSRQNAHIFVDTVPLSPGEVYQAVMDALVEQSVEP